MIGIVGAGLTGLALAHELARRGVEHVVLEAADRPGGVIESARVDGRVLDFGPQRLRMTGAVEALVHELGLGAQVVRAPVGLPLYVYARGDLREVPVSLGALAAGDLLTWRGKLRLAWEPLTATARPDETVAEFFTRKLGKEAYARLAGPIYGGLYASDPAAMVVRTSLAGTLDELGIRRSLVARFARVRGPGPTASACSFRDGMAALTNGLYAGSAGAVRLGCAVRRLVPCERGWRVEGDSCVLEARSVVLTCAADAAAELVTEVSPDAADRLRSLVYNPLAVVHLDAGETGLRGLGYQVAFGESLQTRGVTWNDSLFGHADRAGVYTAFLGGATNPGIVEEPDDRVGAIAAREFARVTGRAARVLAVSRTRMPAWDRSWATLEALRLPAGIETAASWRSRPGIPGRLTEAIGLAEELKGRG